MGRRIAVITLASLTTCIATSGVAQENSRIVKAVKDCVEVVHNMANGFYEHFDAFYNPATARVENNVQFVYEREALYQFHKCMVSQGFPLR